MQLPTVIMFENGIPTKAHCRLFCNCPVGLHVGGICCHVLALLLFLKHWSENTSFNMYRTTAEMA